MKAVSEGSPFRTKFGEDIFNQKYRHEGAETWEELARTLARDVCGEAPLDVQQGIEKIIREMKFIPGGRYLYYAGRPVKYFNNCYLLRSEEDTREDWANLSWKAESCLLSGGGIGNDYSRYRAEGQPISRTGGIASGPISKMLMVDDIGQHVMQGGSRRSAIYASLNWQHADAEKFLYAKDWDNIPIDGSVSLTDYTNNIKKLVDAVNKGQDINTVILPEAKAMSVADARKSDFNYSAPLDMTNISLNYDTKWLLDYWKTGDPGDTFRKNVRQAMKTAEPGFSFNFFDKENETLRNACTEVTSEDDSDVCNLGSINLSRIDSLEEFSSVVELATIFLLYGTLKADLPYEKVYQTREKNRRLGLGLMGFHEWCLKRNQNYGVSPEFRTWLEVYRGVSDDTAKRWADSLSISRPVAVRSIAPTGSIGIIAGTTTGIEPVYAVAYKRRYLQGGSRWKYQYYVDSAAQDLIDAYSIDPESIESATDLAVDYERRISTQADIQDYVDMAISSTCNLPKWGSEHNNEDTVSAFTDTLARYASRLRGFTCYPDGSRGGQPITSVPYKEAIKNLGEVFEENTEVNDVCEITGTGYCGL